MRFRSAFASQVAAALLPSIILLLIVPVVRRKLGLDAFAGFTVLISGVSVLTLFDGGLGRSTTYFTSRHGVQNDGATRSWLWACMLLGVVFSVAIGAAGTLALHLENGSFKAAGPALQVLLAFTPVFVLGAIVKGALEGQRRFALSTGLQLAYGCAISVAPLILVLGDSRLSAFSFSVGLIRTCLVGALAACVPALLLPRKNLGLAGVLLQVRQVFDYTKWLVISNVIGLCIVFADRFVIASHFDARIVASYILPMEMVSRVQLLVAAFCSVIFPTLVMHAERNNPDYFHVVRSAQGVVASGVLAASCVFVPLAEPVFSWWLGASLGGQAAQIGLVSLIGVALIANAALAMVAINSLGHTRQIAILHAIELVIYVVLLIIAVSQQSLSMLLLAWVARQLIDALCMSQILKKLSTQTGLNKRAKNAKLRFLWCALFGAYCLYVAIALDLRVLSLSQRIAIGAVGGAIATVMLAFFYSHLREDVNWMRRSAAA